MSKPSPSPLRGDVLTLEPCADRRGGRKRAGRTFLLEVKDDATSNMLLGSFSLLDRLLVEKKAAVRKRHLNELVDFIVERTVVPSADELTMAQRLAARHARVLNEFGYCTAEQLADANRSQATARSALADNWRKRRQVFAVPHPDRTARERDVYPAFQFEDHKPIKAVQAVLAALGRHKSPWKVALWFTSNSGWLPGSARPVDLLASNPQAVIDAAHHEGAGSGA